jgi:hypothetical protein
MESDSGKLGQCATQIDIYQIKYKAFTKNKFKQANGGLASDENLI